MTGVHPLLDVVRSVSTYRNDNRGHKPTLLRLSKVTLRAVALAGGIDESGVDALVRDWETLEPRGTLLGISIVRDDSLPAGAIACEEHWLL